MDLDISPSTSEATGRNLPWIFRRARWVIALAALLFLTCSATFVYQSLSILQAAYKLVQVDNGICSSIFDLRVLQARQAMAAQTIVELAADGQQELSPTWRSVAIHHQRHSQAFTGSLQGTLVRIQMLEKEHPGLNALEVQLCELAELQERLQNDIQTVIRLTEEKRSEDIAAMHESIAMTGEAVSEQLESLDTFSQIALLNSAKLIKNGVYRLFWAGVGAITFGTIGSVCLWNTRRRRPSVTMSEGEFSKSEDDHHPVGIATEQALNERFLLRGVHVLVAEDDIASRRQLARVFENAGAVVTVACDGEHALHQFRKANASGHPVQLVIMDIRMPVMDGLQAAIQLRELDHFEGPVLALTEANSPSIRDECLDAGFDDFLAKPFERRRLLQVATDYLGKSVPA